MVETPWMRYGPPHPDGIVEFLLQSKSEPDIDRHVIAWRSTDGTLMTSCDCPAGETRHQCWHRNLVRLVAHHLPEAVGRDTVT
jgi:hypothetical protein